MIVRPGIKRGLPMSLKGGFKRPGFPSGQQPSFPPDAEQTGGGAGFAQQGFPSAPPRGDFFKRPGFPSPAQEDGGFAQQGFPSAPPVGQQDGRLPMNGGIIKKPQPGFPGPSGPVNERPVPGGNQIPKNAPEHRMNKFIMDAIQQGFDPKAVLSFLSGKMGKAKK